MTTALKHFPPLYIHPILWFFILVAVVTGTFMEISMIFAIVLIHELGHYSVAKYFRWRIRRVSLWVFGGVMETDEHSSKPMKQELLIIVAGPLQHVWIHGLLLLCSTYDILPPSVISLGFQYNATILFFNLLPIWPLDGGKLLMLLLSSVFAYRKAHSMMIIISVIISVFGIIIFLFYYPFTLSTILLVGFILWENRLEWKRRYYTFIRFLLKRHIDKPNILKVRPIVVNSNAPLMKVFSLFRRNYHHHVYVKDGLYDDSSLMDERECLHTYFKLKHYQATAGDVTGHK